MIGDERSVSVQVFFGGKCLMCRSVFLKLNYILFLLVEGVEYLVKLNVFLFSLMSGASQNNLPVLFQDVCI